MAEHVWSALILAATSAFLAWGSVRVLARLPEPDEAPADKPSYASIAAAPRLAPWLAGVAGLLGALVGLRLGLGGDLVLWVPLVPVFVLLSYVDWRTRYLPTKVIAPTYLVLLGLLLLVAVLPIGDGLDSLKRAAIGWALVGGLYLVMWLVYPKGIGYGDVRLSGILGIALGHLGIAETVVGLYAGFLIGGIGGVLLSRLGVVDKKHYPFGPFMVVGALVGLFFGREIVELMGY